MSSERLSRYLRRLGLAAPSAPTAAALGELIAAHCAAIPFENLDPLLGKVPSLAPDDLHHKLVGQGRGGYCFEHNLLLADVLGALGYRVTGLAARVLWQRPEGSFPRTHMLLAVEADGARWLADVGFGGLGVTGALQLGKGPAQQTPHEPFRLVDAAGDWQLEACLGERWEPLYRFDLHPQLAVDFEPLNHFVATHASSPFPRRLMAARALPDRRLALANLEYTIRHRDGRVERQLLPDGAAAVDVLGRDFGLALQGLPALAARIDALAGVS